MPYAPSNTLPSPTAWGFLDTNPSRSYLYYSSAMWGWVFFHCWSGFSPMYLGVVSSKPELLDGTAFIKFKVWIKVIHTQWTQHLLEMLVWLTWLNSRQVIESSASSWHWLYLMGTQQLCEVCVWNHCDFKTYSCPPGATMQETCSHLDLLDTLKILQFHQGWNSGYQSRTSLGKSQHVTTCERKKFVMCCLYWSRWPVFSLLMDMPTEIRLGTSALLYLWLYICLHRHYRVSSLPEKHTCVHTLWQLRTPSPLPSGRMNPASSLLSQAWIKICWPYLNTFRVLQLVLSCLRKPIQPPFKLEIPFCNGSFIFHPIVK